MAHMANTLNTDIVSWTLGNERYDQDKPILIDASNPLRFLTARKARTTVRQLVAGFKAKGLRPGDSVCVHSFNEIYYPTLYLGIIGAEGQYTGSNPGYTTWELAHHIRTAKVKFIITEPHMLTTALSSARECGLPTSNIYVFDTFNKTTYKDVQSWAELLNHGESDWAVFHSSEKAETTIATLSFTSGTTGLPKAAMIPHSYAVSQSSALLSGHKPYEVIRLLCLPAFHQFGVPLLCANALREGHTVYVMRRFETKAFLEFIHRFKVTETAMVPPMIFALLMSPLATKELLQSLRYMWCGGAPLRQIIQRQMQDLLSPEAKLAQVWGITEIGWGSTLFWPEGDDTGSVGRPLTNLTMKLIGQDGKLVKEDQKQGEIYVKGPCMMLGYLGDPKDGAATFDSEGWLRTGDIGYCKDSKWYIIDRKKELIKVRGWQVAPAELEAVLLTHPKIADAAVIGVQLPDGTGEVPRAYVTRKKQVSQHILPKGHEITTEVEVRSDGAVVDTEIHPTMDDRPGESYDIMKKEHAVEEAANGDSGDMRKEYTDPNMKDGTKGYTNGYTDEHSNEGMNGHTNRPTNRDSSGHTNGDSNGHMNENSNRIRNEYTTEEATEKDIDGHTRNEHANGNNDEPPNNHIEHHTTPMNKKSAHHLSFPELHQPTTHHDTTELKELDEAAVKAYISTRLARYKALDGGVRFVDVIPKSPSGKILKRILRIESQAEETAVGV